MSQKYLRLFISFSFAAVVLAAAFTGSAGAQGKPTIAIIQSNSNSALNTAGDAALAALAADGFADGSTATIVKLNADGDAAKLNDMAKQLVDQKVDLILTLGTPASLAVQKATTAGQGPRVVFVAMLDPFASGVATSACNHPAWITGVQGLTPFEAVVGAILKVKPSAKKIGYIYNPTESNSAIAFAHFQPIAQQLGLTLDVQTVSASADVAAAAQKLAPNVDAFLDGNDNTVTAAAADVVKAANAAKIPVFSISSADIASGVLMTVGVNFAENGRESGHLGALILQGKLDIAKTRITNTGDALVAVNPDAAAALGITLPADVLQMASATPQATATLSAEDEAKALTCSADEMTATAEATP